MYNLLCTITMALLLMAWGPGESFAYTVQKCGILNLKWASSVYTTTANSKGFPVGPWRDALNDVVNRWHNNPSLLGYSVRYTDPNAYLFNLGNGVSEVWWSTGFGAPAATYWWFNTSTCTFTEADILFDSTVPYHYTTAKTSLWPYGGYYRPFQTTAMHEFGHAGGLAHTTNTYNIMGQDWTHIHANGATALAYPGEDASAGMVALYGLWTAGPEDVAVTHWRWTGSSGGYSTHGRTRIFDSAGIELAKVCASCAEPVYQVSKGQTLQLELSYENLGKSTQTVAVGYYLSTNNLITTVDTFLASASLTLSRDTVLTWSKTLTIPSWLTSGTTYWLGAIVDYTGAIAELDESNNATYVGIYVK